jgi:FkbM family methyltransferase
MRLSPDLFAHAHRRAGRATATAGLWWLDARMKRAGSSPRTEQFAGYTIDINDPANYYVLVKDIFHRQIYGFTATRGDPLVVDCGSNIGMSILYFKYRYPRARIVGFEPDPEVFALLQQNVKQNGLDDVKLVQAAVGAQSGRAEFLAGHAFASTLVEDAAPFQAEPVTVDVVRLRDQLIEPVDFLKLNIEGAEHEVMEDIADRLDLVSQLVLEYHHLPGMPRTLHLILARLHEAGFEYLVNDLDARTNPGSQPPFSLGPDARYFALVYAKRAAV